MTKDGVGIKVKIGYGLSDLGGNLFFTIVNFWLLYFLTDMLGLNPAWAGVAIMVGKLWDAVTDPVVGYLSDRTITRWGRRKPYMVAGVIPLFLLTVLLFTKVSIESQGMLLAYITVVYCLVNTAYTVVFIPYTAMLPEITNDSYERTSIMGYRMGFAMSATLIGSVFALPIIQMFPDEATGFNRMALIFGLIMLLSVLATVKMVPTRIYHEKVAKSGILKSYLNVFKNKQFVIVLITMVLCFVSLIMVQSSIIYHFTYVMNNQAATIPGMLSFTLSTVLFIPVILKLAKKNGKKRTWLFGMTLCMVGYVLLFATSGMGIAFSYLALVIAGLGNSATAVCAGACVMDTIEYGCLKTGERNEGSYSGIMTFGQKVGMAFGAASVGWILSRIGYVPDQAQTAETIQGMKIIISLVPAALTLVAAINFRSFKITETEYNNIIEEIEERKQEEKRYETV